MMLDFTRFYSILAIFLNLLVFTIFTVSQITITIVNLNVKGAINNPKLAFLRF